MSETLFLVDTSVWVAIFREPILAHRFRERVADGVYFLSRFTQLELLQGARNEAEWSQLSKYLESQIYFECCESTWTAAARTHFNLRRVGKTVRSPIDCCIAQLAMENGATLLHRDHDFTTIASICPLDNEWF